MRGRCPVGRATAAAPTPDHAYVDSQRPMSSHSAHPACNLRPACRAETPLDPQPPPWRSGERIARCELKVCDRAGGWRCPSTKAHPSRRGRGVECVRLPGRLRSGSCGIGDAGIAPAAQRSRWQEGCGCPRRRVWWPIRGTRSGSAAGCPSVMQRVLPYGGYVGPDADDCYGELAAPSDLADLLALCMAMGLEVVSLRQLPGEAVTRPGPPAPGEAGWAVPVTPVTPRSGPSGLPPRPCIR